MFCNSVSADRSGMAASRFCAAAGTCVILLSFAAGHCKVLGTLGRQSLFQKLLFFLHFSKVQPVLGAASVTF